MSLKSRWFVGQVKLELTVGSVVFLPACCMVTFPPHPELGAVLQVTLETSVLMLKDGKRTRNPAFD